MPKNAQDFRKQKAIERLKKQGISKEQLVYQRKIQKERLEIELTCIRREIKFKDEEVSSGNIIETRAVNQIPGQPAITLDGYQDGLKPKHLLENEMDQLNLIIKQKQEMIDDIKKLEEEDAKSS